MIHRTNRLDLHFIDGLLSLFFVSTVVLTFAGATPAQTGVDSMGTGGKNRIQGRIYFPSGRRSDLSNIKVMLESSSSERILVIADMNGSFTFNNLAAGNYSVTVDAGADYETAREQVLIEGMNAARSTPGIDLSRTNVPRTFSVMVNLQPKPTPGAKRGVVNAALATVPKPALTAYQSALQFAKAGDSRKAVDQLKMALSYYPDFGQALNELGVQYLKLNEPQKAADALRSAVRLMPDDFTSRLNYGIALVESKNHTEAEVHLRTALTKNSGSPLGHMYRGVALIGLNNLAEAESELLLAVKLGGTRLGLPHYYLGGIYWRQGKYPPAVTELEKYLLAAPNAPNAERVRATIKELRSKQSTEPEKP
ncbi:MAG: tetratricopeptide repeat protein [Pyrinomonadaceae bacterium]